MVHRWGGAIVCVLLILMLLARSSTAGILKSYVAVHHPAALIMTHTDCSFEFRRQPPSTTLNDCNPYNNNDRIDIVLQCTVRRMDGISTAFMIRWFRENTTGAVEDLGLGDPDVQQGRDQTSRYHNTAFFNQPYSPSLLGKYWCQVINTTADPDQPLMRSNVFTLLAPGDYSGALCSGAQQVQAEMNETCADELGNTQVITSLVLLTKTPTMSSYHTTTYSISPIPAEQLTSSHYESTIVTTITLALPTAPDDSPTITPALPTAPDDSTTITPTLPTAPATSVIVYVVSGVSGGVLLVTILICCSGVILILVKRRRKTALATAGQPVCNS